ncbi:tyrosine-protein kinase receptor torso-like [Oscarella lobularis]|uniref:tyrosine-protein kinase receptor torso-like n=1 Tax=Oscarella lobularis TaxID=121494 RepID=UPI003314210C
MLLEKIGEGFFGIVRKAYLYRTVAKPQTVQSEVGCDSSSDENKTVVACKMLKDRFLHHDEIDFLEEIKLMKRIGRHPHIVSLMACVTASQPLCLIVEYCCHGDLLGFLQKRRLDATTKDDLKLQRLKKGAMPALSHNSLSEIEQDENEEQKKNVDGDDDERQTKDTHESENDYDTVAEDIEEEGEEEVLLELMATDLLSFAWQIASGMVRMLISREYLAGKNLVHRDLACRNVLVSENNLLKVSDFGLTKAVYEDGAYNQKTARRLPFRWMSIEAIIHRLFSEKSDVWSFGVVLWEIVTLGCFPYPCMASKDLLLHLRSGNRLECPENCSKELYELMSECWRSEPEMRPSFEKLSKQLGKMLEEEAPTKYLNLDVIYMSSYGHLKLTKGRGQSGSASSEKTDDVLAALDNTPGDGADVRQRHVMWKECSP